MALGGAAAVPVPVALVAAALVARVRDLADNLVAFCIKRNIQIYLAIRNYSLMGCKINISCVETDSLNNLGGALNESKWNLAFVKTGSFFLK